MNETLMSGYEIMPTKNSVKEMIVKPIINALYGKKSTTELYKTGEIEKVIDIINKHFGDMGIELPPFPSETI